MPARGRERGRAQARLEERREVVLSKLLWTTDVHLWWEGGTPGEGQSLARRLWRAKEVQGAKTTEHGPEP